MAQKDADKSCCPTSSAASFELERTLNNYEMLNLFKSWMGVDDDSSQHPLDLHFAIVAYRKMAAQADDRHIPLAREIYCRFLRLKTGLCDFIDAKTREQIGRRLRQLKESQANQLPEDVFDECFPSLTKFLHKQHDLFTESHEFLDFFNRQQRMVVGGAQAPHGGAQKLNLQQKQRSSKAEPSSATHHGEFHTAPLTADALLRSQHDREVLVGENNSMLQKLFKPVSKFPYVGNAQTSKNDSAVSSSFSSDAHGSRKATRGGKGFDVRGIREEQMRCNQLHSGFPKFVRVEIPIHERQAQNSFRHDLQRGRQEFVEALTKKLEEVALMQFKTDKMNEEIEIFADATAKDEDDARKLIIIQASADQQFFDESTAVVDDADIDIDNYIRQRLHTESTSRQSPMISSQSRKTRREKSPRSSSPFDKFVAENEVFAITTKGSHRDGGGGPIQMMTQSFIPSAGISHHHQQQQPARAHSQHHKNHYSKSPERSNFFYGGGGGNGTCVVMPSSAAASYYAGYSTTHMEAPPVQILSNLYAGPPPPPPRKFVEHHRGSFGQDPQFQRSKMYYCENDGDTSGIGSMTTTHISEASNSSGLNNTRRKAAFRKANELSSGGTSHHNNQQHYQKQQQAQFFDGGDSTSRYGTRKSCSSAKQTPTEHAFGGTMPRSRMATNSCFHGQGAPMITICYRDCKKNVPVVASVPQRPITLKEFRRYFSISSHDNRQFFFKTASEDGSAPYQLTLISDESALLPVFEGKITAECRQVSSDSD